MANKRSVHTMDGHNGFGSEHGTSASSRATNVPIPPSASHVPEDPPTTLHGSARKRKKQNTANSATLGPRKRHCKSNGSQLHIATTTSSQDEPESDADSGELTSILSRSFKYA